MASHLSLLTICKNYIQRTLLRPEVQDAIVTGAYKLRFEDIAGVNCLENCDVASNEPMPDEDDSNVLRKATY